MLERLTPTRIARSIAYRTGRLLTGPHPQPVYIYDIKTRNSPDFLSMDLWAAKHKLLQVLAALPYPKNYIVSKRWRSHLDTMLRAAKDLKSPTELAWLAQRVFDVEPTPITPGIYGQFESDSRRYRQRFPELSRATESSFLAANEVAVIDGLGYSAKLGQAFSYYADIHDGISEMGSIKTIVEIGSGNGRMARLMRIVDPSRKYVLVDLPESLFFAYSFLRSNFPDARLHISAPGEIITSLKDFDFVFCPVQLVENLQVNDVDLVINTYSFAEMTQGCVDYLLSVVDRVIKPRFLYSLNMVFVDKANYHDTGGLDGDGNDTVLNHQPIWYPRRFVLVPAVNHEQFRITVSIVLERRDASREQVLAQIAQAEKTTTDLQVISGLRFFKAAWSEDADALDQFCDSLKVIYRSFGFPEPDLSAIGEVKFLKAKHALDN